MDGGRDGSVACSEVLRAIGVLRSPFTDHVFEMVGEVDGRSGGRRLCRAAGSLAPGPCGGVAPPGGPVRPNSGRSLEHLLRGSSTSGLEASERTGEAASDSSAVGAHRGIGHRSRRLVPGVGTPRMRLGRYVHGQRPKDLALSRSRSRGPIGLCKDAALTKLSSDKAASAASRAPLRRLYPSRAGSHLPFGPRRCPSPPPSDR